MKLLFLTNIPSPYRVDFFNQLGKKNDLTVLFEEKPLEHSARNLSWFNENYQNFRAVFLERKITIGKKFICIDVIKYLREEWDTIVFIGYDSPTQILGIEWMNAHKKIFFLESDGGFIKNDKKLKFLLKHHLISSADAWLSTGQFTTDYFVHYGAKRDRVYEYPFTSLLEKDILDASRILQSEKIEIRKKLHILEPKVIVSVGRFTYKNGYGKGFDLLLDIAPSLGSDVGIYIIGDDPTSEFLDRKKNEKLDNIHFIDFQKKDELSYYYAAADLFVLLTRMDVWGLVINEAMSFALPIITTNKCGAGLTLVENGINGYIIDLDDENVMAEIKTRIKDLLENHETRDLFGTNSLRKIKEYTIESMSQQHERIISNINRGGRKYSQ